jgi:hypothetical protein
LGAASDHLGGGAALTAEGAQIMLETLFLGVQAIALLGWAALFALPWVGRRRAILWARWVAVPLCLVYLFFLFTHFGAIPRDEGYTLAALGRAFDRPVLLLAGWIHYLIFDLWVGSWEAEHAEKIGLSHSALLPCLFATMMIGPLGLLLYLGVAALKSKRAGDR